MSRSFDLVVRGGWLPTAEGIEAASIAVADGEIVEVGPEVMGSGREEIDAKGLVMLPGVVDAHVHFNEPGRAHWEGFATGSAAVAAGGGTCFIEMPLNASPPTVTAEAFDQKLAAAQQASRVDFALWGGLVPGHIGDMPDLADRGVVGFKAFMSHSGIDDFPLADDATLLAGMRQAAALDLPVAVHAENEAITAALAREAIAAGRTGVRDFLLSRPALVELEAIQRAILLAGETDCSLHIVHVSTAAGIVAVAEARQRGIKVTCETCPHYLVLTDEDMERLGSVAKCAPVLRERGEVESLWSQLQAGNVDWVASDHSPSPPEMKSHANFFTAWGGIAGCQSLLPLLLEEGHRKRGIALATIAELASTAVARRFRLPRKGRIEVGFDADIVLVDLHAGVSLTAADLHYRHAISPYLGMPIHGLVNRTLLRGMTVFADNKASTKARGRLVRPSLACSH